MSTLLNKRVIITETTQGKITRLSEGTVAAVGYYGGDALKKYHRGWDVLILKDDGTLESVTINNITLI